VDVDFLAPGAFEIILDDAFAQLGLDESPFILFVRVDPRGMPIASFTVIPEPATLLLAALGLAGLAVVRKRRATASLLVAACLLLAPVSGSAGMENGHVDTDGDQIIDLADNCIYTPNTNQKDTNDDGRGDACECGDFSGDGHVNTTDARLIQRCAVGQIPCATLCDVTNDGQCNTTDARIIQRFAVGQFGKYALVCAELLGPP
jgi:hypothetical protein